MLGPQPTLDQVQWAYDGSTCLAIAKGHVSIQLYGEALHEELLAKALFAPSVKATTCAGF